MSQPGPDAAKRSKKRKLRQSKPLLEQIPAVPVQPSDKPGQQHKQKRQHRQQPEQQQQEQQPDASSAGNTKFARALGSTDFHTREQGLQALSRWLTHKPLISELDMLKLWKGIYFCFWHSDKEPVQADLADRLSRLITRMQPGMAVLYWSAMLSTLRSEWFALDRHRLNKFLMLVRKFVGAVFTRLAADDWSVSSIESFCSNLPMVNDVMPSSHARSLGLSYHLADVWLPELRKVCGEEPLPAEALQALLEPFVAVMQLSGEAALVNRVRESVFEPLVQDLTAASASAAGGGNDSSSDDEDDATTWTYCTQQDTASYAALLFDRGAQQGVKARNREALYSISKDLERVAGKRRKAAADAAAVPLGKQTQQKEQQQQQLEQLGRQAKKHKQPAKQQQGQQVEPTEVVANGDAEPPSGKKQRKQAQLQQQQQQQAEQAAAAAAAAATPGTVGKRKKQKKQAADAKHAALSAAAGVANGSASPGKRGVKIDLKKNLYFEHGAPPPAADVRTPPKAKPKGSALKSAVKLDSSGRPTVPATAPAGGQQQQGARRKLVTPSSVPRLRAAEFF